MGTVVGDIAISVGADIGPLVRDLTKGSAAVSKFGRDAQASGGGMLLASKAGLALSASVLAASAGMGILFKRTIDTAGVLHDLSSQTGISVANLQAMTQVAGEAGVAQEGLAGAIKKMQVSLGGLQAGTKAQTEAFGALGLSYSDFAGLSPDEQFARLAASIASIEDPMLKTNAAIDVFGKAGADLIPMMQGYGAAVAAAAAHQEALGIAMSDADAAQLDDLGDSMGRLGDSAEGAATQFAILFGPAAIGAVTFLSHSMEGLNGMFRDFRDILETTPEEGVFIAIGKNAEMASAQLNMMALAYSGLSDGTISAEMMAIADHLKAQELAFATGAISAEVYKTKMEASFAQIIALIQQVETLDGTDMSGAIGMMNGYATAIRSALGLMNQLASAGPGPSFETGGRGGNPAAVIVQTPGPDTPRPPSTLDRTNIDFGDTSDTGGVGGDGGGSDPMQGRIDALVSSLQTQSEIVNEWYIASQAALQAASDAELATIGGRQAAIERLEEEHQERLKGIKDAGNDSGVESVLDGGALILGAMGSTNKKAMQLQTKFAAASALISAYQGAAKELERGALGFQTAALVIARGISFVNAIKTTGNSASGGGGGGSSGSSGGSSAAAGSTTEMRTANINFYGGFQPTQDTISMIANGLNDWLGDGGKLKVAQS